jgi:hypothetical protein
MTSSISFSRRPQTLIGRSSLRGDSK